MLLGATAKVVDFVVIGVLCVEQSNHFLNKPKNQVSRRNLLNISRRTLIGFL